MFTSQTWGSMQMPQTLCCLQDLVLCPGSQTAADISAIQVLEATGKSSLPDPLENLISKHLLLTCSGKAVDLNLAEIWYDLKD